MIDIAFAKMTGKEERAVRSRENEKRLRRR